MENDVEKVEVFVDRLKKEMGYVIRFTEFDLKKGDPKPTFALRISTHLFHDKDQVDGAVDAMYKILKTM